MKKIIAHTLRALTSLMTLLLLAVSGLVGCSKEDEPAAETVVPQVIFLFSPGGLGDLSYNDCILSGLQRFKNEFPHVDVFMYSPPSLETAERIFSDWMKRPGSDIPVVFVLASSDFEPLVDRYSEIYSLTPNKRILLFESLKKYPDDKIYTFQVSMYGASYLAGCTARGCDSDKGSLVVLGSSADVPILSARDGFMEGLGKECDVESLADDWTGYVMAPEAYRKMKEWAPSYGFVFPVAGGSNMGIYRYSREYPDSPFLAGMDVDQSQYSDRITGSVVKHFDRLIVEYLSQWLEEGTMPETDVYGLESGYVDWVLSPRYEGSFSDLIEGKRGEAIQKERDYYEISD